MVAYASTLPTTETSIGTSLWVTFATVTGAGPPPSRLRRPPFRRLRHHLFRLPPLPLSPVLASVVEPVQPLSAKAAKAKHAKAAHAFVRFKLVKMSLTK